MSCHFFHKIPVKELKIKANKQEIIISTEKGSKEFEDLQRTDIVKFLLEVMIK